MHIEVRTSHDPNSRRAPRHASIVARSGPLYLRTSAHGADNGEALHKACARFVRQLARLRTPVGRLRCDTNLTPRAAWYMCEALLRRDVTVERRKT